MNGPRRRKRRGSRRLCASHRRVVLKLRSAQEKVVVLKVRSAQEKEEGAEESVRVARAMQAEADEVSLSHTLTLTHTHEADEVHLRLE